MDCLRSRLHLFMADLIRQRGASGSASMNRIDRSDRRPKYWYMEEEGDNVQYGSKGSFSPNAKPCCHSRRLLIIMPNPMDLTNDAGGSQARPAKKYHVKFPKQNCMELIVYNRRIGSHLRLCKTRQLTLHSR